MVYRRFIRFVVAIGLVGTLLPIALVGTATASATTIGNDAVARPFVDTYQNFVIVDTNNPSSIHGSITSFDYWAAEINTFRFLVVDGSYTVRWISDPITPGAVGFQTFTPSSPVGVEPGWNVAIYSASTGVIPFDQTGSPAWYTPDNSGLPTVGTTLVFEGSDNRHYSFVAHLAPNVPLTSFRDVRRGDDINVGPDLCNTGHESVNFTGSTGSAGDTWITVYDTTPANNTVKNTFGDSSATADVIIKRFNNKKGAGLLARFNDGAADRGLALVIFNAGNTDTLALGTVSATDGKFTPVQTTSLGNRIAECNWYELHMDVTQNNGTVTVEGTVYRHTVATDPDSPTTTVVGTLLYVGALPTGVQTTGEVGIVAAATSAVVDSSVTNFTVNGASNNNT